MVLESQEFRAPQNDGGGRRKTGGMITCGKVGAGRVRKRQITVNGKE